ncbi:glycosyltransferase family 2 protein [Geobacillus stearothermophilus]|uniref:glycosyltransferase family 2 protein n=1 Tax=Geobacillus stearothermophilus TaxID=1422 RepID=UPI0007AB2EAB|nr:glycosyltransferase family 2 protein [Geobacillus stearothermophilus]KZE97368.1 Poly-beta-1,6-N-acetyl-D-glucosamine synthase [Geobacillus stearothermophilus]MED4271856.1 glycosyltransferase family 2 protein [Geobacillus stearothermophilus]
MRQVTEKHVAIIILNWNAYNDTFECLKSLEHLTYPYFHVFLVDNASQDGSFDKLQLDCKDGKFNVPITFIQTGANLGFAGGNNAAIKEAYEQGYQYFWMLNNDTVVDPNALTPLVEALEKDKQVGIVGSKIYYYGTNRVWFAGGKINLYTGKSKHIGLKQQDNPIFNIQKEVDYITGCSLFFRKEIIELVGYMSDDYFLYYEETEWNIRAKEKGFKIFYVPKSVVYHKVSASSGKGKNVSPYVDYYDLRNSYVMIYRTQKRLINKFIVFLYMYYRFIKKCIKIFFVYRNRIRERMWYLYRGVLDAIFLKMGKHPVYPNKQYKNNNFLKL